MSSSRRSETSADGVGLEDESVKRIFPPALMKSRRIFGVRCGPSPRLSAGVHCVTVQKGIITFRLRWQYYKMVIRSFS